MKGGPNGPDGPERQVLSTSPTPIVHAIPDPPIEKNDPAGTMFGAQGAVGSPSGALGGMVPTGTDHGSEAATNAQGQRRGIL